MYKLFATLLIFVAGLSACTTAQIQQTLDNVLGDTPLTDAEVGGGLKEALNIGIGKGADLLSQKDGYFKSSYKILLPAEARKVTDRLKNVPGFSNVENIILEKINRGAEDAAQKAKPIFVTAIKSMSFQDAMGILMGNTDAATRYLERTTYNQLYQEFNPVIAQSLDKFEARKYWSDAVNTYNKIPLVEKANPDLGDYVTKEALKGLFSMVEKEEINIRRNAAARTTDLLRKVFAKQDNK
ncbi:MAG: DUF4197 domain-containing protein [Saprospiraceae bacterium]|jgi:hypothetical protein|nr:DUF4197 domain-containing protein [Saprospiraceae bacterium]